MEEKALADNRLELVDGRLRDLGSPRLICLEILGCVWVSTHAGCLISILSFSPFHSGQAIPGTPCLRTIRTHLSLFGESFLGF